MNYEVHNYRDYYQIHHKDTRFQIEKLADKGDPQLVKDVLEGWEDIKDEDGNDVAFTKKELDGFLNDINFIKGTVQAIIDMQKGAPEKN